ncbi:uncharacterized protein [Palaemon carinicauda]|uniref:uncharacterized protein n=1 Tax=Palaemon carinicauda TaxID=392227 RepID=UPI0035B5A0C5
MRNMDCIAEISVTPSSTSHEIAYEEIPVEEAQDICITIEHFEDMEYQTTIEEADNLEWMPEVFNLIEVSDDGYVSGYVRTEEELHVVLQTHGKHTESMFGLDSDDGLRKQKRPRRLFYYSKLLDLSSHITSSDRSRTYICNFGMRYMPSKKIQERHDYANGKIRKAPSTSKTGCPSKICINEITVYTDYSIDGLSRRARRDRLNALKEALVKAPQDINFEKYIHIRLPLKCTHKGHIVSEREWRAKKTHPCLLKKIEEFTFLGIRKISIMKALLKAYAEDSLIEGDPEEVRDLTYFFPNEKTIENKMRSVIRQNGLSLIHIEKGRTRNKPKKTLKVRCSIPSNGSNILRIKSKKVE